MITEEEFMSGCDIWLGGHYGVKKIDVPHRTKDMGIALNLPENIFTSRYEAELSYIVWRLNK